MQIARNVCYRKAIFGKAKKQVFRLEHLLSILKAIFSYHSRLLHSWSKLDVFLPFHHFLSIHRKW